MTGMVRTTIGGGFCAQARSTLLKIDEPAMDKAINMINIAVEDYKNLYSTAPVETQAWEEPIALLKTARFINAQLKLMKAYTDRSGDAASRRKVTREQVTSMTALSIPASDFPLILQNRMRKATKGQELD